MEALERARAAYGTGAYDDATIEYLFPEVKESEDERIRKFLVKHVSEWIGCIEHDLKLSSKDVESEEELAMFKACLAYLERQKEPLIPEEKMNHPLYLEGFDVGKKVGEVLKEQKPEEGTALQKAFISSKIDYTLEEKCDASDYADAILPTSVTYGENEEEYKLHKIIEAAFIAGQKKEQQPAEWSEEDERAIDRACVALRAYSNGDLPEFLPSELLNYADRLQSLRPQPKQELSEEEQQIIEDAACAILRFSDTVETKQEEEELCKLASKLQDLKPKSHWRPSKEQMRFLLAVINNPNNAGAESCHLMLQSLYTDLQKLL